MKYAAILSVAALVTFSLGACNEGENNETTTDTMVAETQTEPMANEITFYDLTSGNVLHRDQASGNYVDDQGVTATFYVNPATADTFEAATGRNVNNAMVRLDNTWSIDEAKVKINEDKMVVQDDDSKLKVKEDKAKLLTEDQKIKVKEKSNGETEVKVKDR